MSPFPSIARSLTAAAAGLALATGPVLAHHPMGGTLPQTITQGLLSGFGHPIIGVDHLAFVIAVGIAAGLSGRVVLLAGIFAAATLAGLALHLSAFDLWQGEFLVAASVLVAGLLLLSVYRAAALPWAVLALAGLFHGYAYGESIIGGQGGVIAAYLIGFTAIQTAIVVGLSLVTRRVAHDPRIARFGGAAIAAVGLVFLAT